MNNLFLCKCKEDRFFVLNKKSGLWYVGKWNEEKKLPQGEFCIEDFSDTDTYKKLKNDGIFDDKTAEIEQPFCDELNLLILDTTKACNLACKYCFVAAPSKGEHMTLQTALKSLDLALAYPKCNNVLTVEFSGGEPLVNFTLIKDFIPIALDKAAEKNKKLTFTIQTNGTLLNEEIINFLVQYDVNIGISIDGTKEFHDKNRIFVDGSGSCTKIMENIATLQSLGSHASTLSVISSPEQYDSVIDFALQNNISAIRTNLVTKAGRAKDKDDFTVDYAKLADKYIEVCQRIFEGELRIHDATLTYFLWNLLLNQPHMCFRSPCGSGTNQVSVTSDGNLYPCQGWRNIHDNPVCNVNDIADLNEALCNNERVKELRAHNVRDIEVCKSCNWSAFCGVCPREIYSEKGTLNEKIGMCIFQSKICEELIWCFEKYPDSIKEYLLGAY